VRSFLRAKLNASRNEKKGEDERGALLSIHGRFGLRRGMKERNSIEQRAIGN
jgi:hypothetical protein